MGKKNTTETNETIYDAVALVYLKYEGERIAPGTAFKVKESDVEELNAKECAQITEIKEKVDEPPSNLNGAGGQQGENGGE